MQSMHTSARAVLVPIDTIPAVPVRWLWPGVIPLGKLTLLAGDPGLGKSFITLDIAARASRGVPFPGCGAPPGGGLREPIGTVLLSAEDDPADTVRPRLEALGADLSRIRVLECIDHGRGRVDDYIIGEHTRLLDEALAGVPDCGLLVVDPVSAYVGGVDSYNNAQVRGMLRPLADLASARGIAVVLVTHLRKDESARLLHRAMGSLAFAAASRVVLAVVETPRDPGRRALVVVKSNLAGDQAAMSYTIDDGVLAWGGPIDPEGLTEGTPPGGIGGGGGGGGASLDREAVEGVVREIRGVIEREGRIKADECRRIARSQGVNDRFVGFSEWKREHGLASRRMDGSWWIAPEVGPGDKPGENEGRQPGAAVSDGVT